MNKKGKYKRNNVLKCLHWMNTTWCNIIYTLKNQTKLFNKRPIGLIGPLSNCTVAFKMHIHVHYNYSDFLIPQFFLILKQIWKNCIITYSDMIKQIRYKKIIGRNHTILPYIIIGAMRKHQNPWPRGNGIKKLWIGFLLHYFYMYYVHLIDIQEKRRIFFLNH